jgi:hypothetical protein
MQEAKVYLNGDEVYRGAGFLDSIGPVTLRQGTNVLVLKVATQTDDWEGCARFVDRDGNPVQGLEVRLTPDTSP